TPIFEVTRVQYEYRQGQGSESERSGSTRPRPASTVLPISTPNERTNESGLTWTTDCSGTTDVVRRRAYEDCTSRRIGTGSRSELHQRPSPRHTSRFHPR